MQYKACFHLCAVSYDGAQWFHRHSTLSFVPTTDMAFAWDNSDIQFCDAVERIVFSAGDRVFHVWLVEWEYDGSVPPDEHCSLAEQRDTLVEGGWIPSAEPMPLADTQPDGRRVHIL